MALCNVPRGQKGLCKKSQDKNALYNVPRGQKGVCKNKSPDQITLYNNFVQLSERSNCASDHMKRNLIFCAKFSKWISKIKQKQKPLAICLVRYKNFLQLFQETELFIVVRIHIFEQQGHCPSFFMRVSKLWLAISDSFSDSVWDCEFSDPAWDCEEGVWLWDKLYVLSSSRSYKGENLIHISTDINWKLDPKVKTWSIFLLRCQLMHCCESLDYVRHHFWFSFLEALQWEK